MSNFFNRVKNEGLGGESQPQTINGPPGREDP